MTDMRTQPTPSSATTTHIDEVSLPPVGRIVVAVDGSDASAAAFAWAADEALCRGMPVRVVTAFAEPRNRSRLRRIEEAMRCQRRIYQQVRRQRPWLEDIEQIVRRGPLRTLLTKATSPADLLVLGGSSGLTAAELLNHVSCPVVVVPAAAAADRPPHRAETAGLARVGRTRVDTADRALTPSTAVLPQGTRTLASL